MYVRRIGKIFTILIVVLSAVSCAELGIDLSESDGDEDSNGIPESVVEIAAGLTELLDMVLSSEDPPTAPDSQEYPEGYPDGMSVEWANEAESELTFSLTDFIPPDDDNPPTVNGTMTITDQWESGASTATLTVSGSFTMSNFTHSSCSMEAQAVFGADPATGEWTSDEPDSVTGTFTVDGVIYDFAAVIDAIEQGENGDDETPDELTYSVTVTGLDSTAEFDILGGQLVIMVLPDDLATDPEPGDVLAVNRTEIDSATHTLELREAVVSEAEIAAEPNDTPWERTPDAAYNLVVYLDGNGDGPDKTDYYAAGAGSPFYGVDCLTLPYAGGTVVLTFPGSFRLPPNERPDLMPTEQLNWDVAVNERFTIPLDYSDRDDDPVEIVVETPPSHGELDVPSGEAELAYTPDEGYTGDDSFSLYATDGRDDSFPLTFNVRVLPAGDHVARFAAAQEKYVTFGSIAGFTQAGS